MIWEIDLGLAFCSERGVGVISFDLLVISEFTETTVITPRISNKNQKRLTRLGLDPRTLSVLTIRDNQLHHPAVACSWQLMAIYSTPI